MDLGLNQRVALVTGASSGLGLAIARALAAERCAAAMVARRQDVLEREARDIVGNSKGRAVPLGEAAAWRAAALEHRARQTAWVREHNRERVQRTTFS